MMRSRYEERTYRLFSEWLKDNLNYEYLDNMAGDYAFVDTLFDGRFADTSGTYDNIYMEETDRDIANEMLNKYVVPRYYNWAIGWIDGEETEDS